MVRVLGVSRLGFEIVTSYRFCTYVPCQCMVTSSLDVFHNNIFHFGVQLKINP